MIIQKKIGLLCNLNGKKSQCVGDIHIDKINEKTAYGQWQILDETGKNIAGVARSYYHGKGESVQEKEILDLVIENIENYRVSRKQVFSNIQII
jgi:hypothetical protein